MGALQRITASLGKLVGKVKRFVSKRKVQASAAALAVAYLLYRRRRAPSLDPSRTVNVPVSGAGMTY